MHEESSVFNIPNDVANEGSTNTSNKCIDGINCESGGELIANILNSDSGNGDSVSNDLVVAEISASAVKLESLVRTTTDKDGEAASDTLAADGDGNVGGVVGNRPSVTGAVLGKQQGACSIEQLIETTKTDVGACFEPDALDLLAALSEQNPAEFRRLRQKLKDANPKVSVSALDRAITQLRSDEAPPPTHHVFALALIADLTSKGHKPKSAEGVLYVLNTSTNIWSSISVEELERRVAELHDGKANCERRADYSSVALHAMNLCADPQFFADAPVGVACPDGFYSVANGEITVVPLQPQHRQRLLLNFAPTESAIPLFEGFLHQTFQSNREGEALQQIQRVQEITGAAMFGLMPRFHKAAMYQDPYGRAGKGTLCDIQVALVPSEFVTNVSPFKWGNEYYLATLARSRLNLVGELPENTPLPAAEFKTVTGGDILTGRHPTGRPFTFRNQAAHIFSSNHLPNTRDQSDAFFTRWLLVEFPNSRLRTGQPLDIGLAERIVTSELPGIAHWAMQGGLRLLQNGEFSESMAGDRLMAKWRQSTNSLEEYIGECCDIGVPTYSVKRAALYEAYVVWCRLSGRKPYAKGHVKDLLEHNIKFGITLGSKDGYELFRGIKFKVPGDFPDLY